MRGRAQLRPFPGVFIRSRTMESLAVCLYFAEDYTQRRGVQMPLRQGSQPLHRRRLHR